MAVHLEPDEVRRTRARELQAWHAEWSAKMLAKGVDPSTPDDRKEPSDYNQHGPDLEASGADLDEYWERARKIIGVTPQ